jgi:hypothetical protein
MDEEHDDKYKNMYWSKHQECEKLKQEIDKLNIENNIIKRTLYTGTICHINHYNSYGYINNNGMKLFFHQTACTFKLSQTMLNKCVKFNICMDNTRGKPNAINITYKQDIYLDVVKESGFTQEELNGYKPEPKLEPVKEIEQIKPSINKNQNHMGSESIQAQIDALLAEKAEWERALKIEKRSTEKATFLEDFSTNAPTNVMELKIAVLEALGELWELKNPKIESEVLKIEKPVKKKRAVKPQRVRCECRSWHNGYGGPCNLYKEEGTPYCRIRNKEMAEYGGLCLGMWCEPRPEVWVHKAPSGAKIGGKIGWKNEVEVRPEGEEIPS